MPDVEVVRDGARLWVRFTRPAALNALTPHMLATAAEALHAAAGDDGVRVVALTGEGRAFSSGADIVADRTEADGDDGTLAAANDLVRAIVACPKPVVAALNGLAAGVGATVALACDLHVLRRSGFLLLAFANIGLMPDGGATAIVPAAIGRARASRMSLLAERIPAEQALAWGLVSHVADDDAWVDEVEALLAKLADGPTQAYARTKAALAAAVLPDLVAAQEREVAGQAELFGTADVAEGRAAFRERRPARFTGR